MLEVGSELHGFVVRSTEDLSEIDGQAILMDHPKTGAKLLYLKNDDENKAFSITFKTPPADDTGVFHILEHSVLCGSDRFPVKEPFVNLLRTSMQTFLNAMTFPDKTMYPVASTNEQDLLNLIDVYLDAVLYPMLYTDRHIFEQEGWHYEIERNESGEPTLVYNGVVFNEMKGNLSDPETVLYHAVNKALFPQSCYAFESGGHPRAIPQLSYESYCDSHARHYNLANSYIVLYGDLDISRVLGFLAERMDGEAGENGTNDANGVDSANGTNGANDANGTGECKASAPNPMGTIAPVCSFDNVVEMATSPENAMVGAGYVIGSAHDFERVLAVDILLDALMGGNESPIKRAVLDAQLGGDCAAYIADAQEQPFAFFVLKNAKPGVAQQFRELVEAQARKLVEEGIPRDVLEASLAQMSFALRERDRGIADGVVLAMNAMSGWLYNDADATRYLHYEEPLAAMRAGLDGRYFEDVLAGLLLDSNHAALVDLQPADVGDAAEEEAELAAKLAGLSESELAAIDEQVAALRARQEAPDSPEDVAKLPQLRASDIGPAKPDSAVSKRSDFPLPCLYHDLPARHINYLYLYFDMSALAWDDMPYASILATLLGNLDTEAHTAAELDVLVRQHLGRLNFFTDTYTCHNNPEQVSCSFVVSVSALAEEADSLAAIPQEVWATTSFDDAGRIRDLLVQKRIAMEESFISSGHMHAMGRVASYLFPSGVLAQQLGGIDFYMFLKDLLENFDVRFDALRTTLARLQSSMFTAPNCIASFTGTSEELEAFWTNAQTMGLKGEVRSVDDTLAQPLACIPQPQLKREAYLVPGDVVYVAKGANLGMLDNRGVWTILARALSFDYLWNEVRVKGGAYGCGFRSSEMGLGQFYSFRDPQLDATLERFDAAAVWLRDFTPDENEMDGYIVATVASHDAPTKPRAIARRQDAALFANRPEAWREQVRGSMLETTAEDVHALSADLAKCKESQAICVLGSSNIINNAHCTFDECITLLNEA